MNASTNEYTPDVVLHPGVTLEEVLEERSMTNKELAIRTKKPEKTISHVINGRSAITPEMAVLFEDVLNIPASFWMKKQMHCNEYLAKKEKENRLQDAISWARKFPYLDMAKLGWVPPARKAEEKAYHLFRFFNIGHKDGWEALYMKKEIKASFRMSLKGSKSPHALSAWLMKGELLAQQMDVAVYNQSKLKKSLSGLKNLVATYPDNFQEEIVRFCKNVGIKLVFTPCLPGAPVNGVTRWINKKPIIQLSDRWKRFDIFCFTLFHEIGHILLHNKKFVSMENVDYDMKDMEKETEADEFAVKWTFSHEEEKRFIEEFPSLTTPDVVCFAREINTHPSLIVGRLARNGYISHSEARNTGLLEEINISAN